MNQLGLEEKSSVIAPFFIVLFVFFVPISPSLKSIMAGLGLAALLLVPYYRKKIWTAFDTLWARVGLILFVYVIIASFWSDASFSLSYSVIDKYSKAIYIPILAVGFINPKTRSWAINSYFIAMLLTCVLSFLKYNDLFVIRISDDIGEIFYNHIATGFMVAFAVYFAAAIAFDASIGKWQRAFCWLMISAGSYQIFFLSDGRTGYVIYALLMSILIIQKLPVKKAALGILLFFCSIGLVYLSSPLMQKRTVTLISELKLLQQHEKNTSLGHRIQFHRYAYSLFEQHPLLGIGTGGFKLRFAQDKPVPEWPGRLNEPHSQYWFTLVEGGIVGLGLYLAFIGSLFILAFQLSKIGRILILGPLVAVCIGSFTDSIFCYSPVSSVLIIVCAMGAAELLEKRDSKETVKEKDISSSQDAKLVV